MAVSAGDITRSDGGATTFVQVQARNQREEKAREARSNQEQWLVFNLST